MTERFRFARLLGFDFLRDRVGRWWHVETNDVPSNLLGADKLATDVFGPSRVLQCLANELARTPSPGVVVLLRPPQRSDGYSPDADADEDLHELCRTLKELGRDCVIATPDQLDSQNGLQLSNGKTISAAFRRTRLRPDCAPTECTINPSLTSFVCRDKLLAPSVLEWPKLPSVPTVLAQPGVSLPSSDSGLWIRKPRFGSGSRGIVRFGSDDELHDEQSTGHVLQPWIEPSTVHLRGRPYYYDVRILSFDGVVIGGYARCAAAPAGGIAKGLPLEWLTTTGRRLPLKLSSARTIEEAVFIEDSERTLLCDAVKHLSRSIETAVQSYVWQETVGRSDETPDTASIKGAVLYVGGATDSQSLASCANAIESAQNHLPSIGICDIDAVAGDWDTLSESTGWELMPQLIAGREHFLGSRVIDEAIRSGEVLRALAGTTFGSRTWSDVTSRIQLIPNSEHESDVWGVTASSDGSVQATCSADGSICMLHNEVKRRYRFGPRWINAISLSPCGRLLVCGTAEPAVYYASIADTALAQVTKVTGDTRWVNGALAVNDKVAITCSSDGRLAMWGAGARLLATSLRKCRGHVLGMLASQAADRFYVWSSDGMVSVHSTHDLATTMEWSAPTRRYVTAAAESNYQGNLAYFAIDIQGKLYSTFSSESICSLEERTWAVCTGSLGKGLRLFTVGGRQIDVELDDRTSASSANMMVDSSPTACRALPGGHALVGLSNGKVVIC